MGVDYRRVNTWFGLVYWPKNNTDKCRSTATFEFKTIDRCADFEIKLSPA